jgi:beta-glucosidase
MHLSEKIGQMVMAARARTDFPDVAKYQVGALLSGGGSTPARSNEPPAWAEMVDKYQGFTKQTRLRIPLLYGIDAVHGHGNVKNATIFPHNIGLGCTRDADLVERVAHATAVEVAATGMHWTFAPVVAAARDERWGRTYEAFGETPELAAQLGPAAIVGFQGKRLGSGPASILATAKHFAGDGGTAGGVDRGDTVVAEAAFRRLHVDQYAPAIAARVGSIMVSYSSYQGVKMHAQRHWLTEVLKEELGFDGILLSDWEGIDKMPMDYSEQLETAVNAGLDMIMAPKKLDDYVRTLESLVPDRVPQWRIDDAVTRILSVKCEMGMTSPSGRARPRLDHVGSAEHREIAREAVRKSLVLLKNDRGVLPLKKNAKVHLAGKSADDLGNQCGGWTISWQGASGLQIDGTTIRQGVEHVVGAPAVSYSRDGTDGKGATVGVAVIGEFPYAELKGDRTNLALDSDDVKAVQNLKAAGLPVVVVLVTGRPLILEPILAAADAVLVAWLPGTEGQGVADILFGDYAPTGKLSHSWPRSMQQIPINIGDANYDPLFPYEFGLTYE